MRNVAMSIAPDSLINSLTVEDITNKSVIYGGIFTLRGSLTLKDKSAAVGIPVAIELKRENESVWTKALEVNSGLDGTVAIPIKIAGTTSFRLRTEGTWERAESVSSEAKIVVLSRLVLERPTTVRRFQEIIVKGSLLPQLSGQSAVLQKLTAGKWQNIGTSTLTGSNGEFELSAIESKKGVVKLRVQVTTKTEQVLSSQFWVVVR
jgi:hypothetical protein